MVPVVRLSGPIGMTSLFSRSMSLGSTAQAVEKAFAM